MGLPWCPVVKYPPANAGDRGATPGPGRSHLLWSNQARVPQLLSLYSGAQERHYWSPCTLERVLHNKRSHPSEKPQPHIYKVAPARCTWAQRRRPSTRKKEIFKTKTKELGILLFWSKEIFSQPLKMYILGTSLVVQVLWLRVPNMGGLGSTPGQGTRFHMPQLQARMPQTKTWCSQINKYIFFKVYVLFRHPWWSW